MPILVEDNFDRMIMLSWKALKKERQNKTSSNVIDDDVYFNEINDDNIHDGDSNSCNDNFNPNSNSGDKMHRKDDLDDNRWIR